jgi:hypothetical protein
MVAPPPQQPHAVPPDPPAIRVEADAETARRFERHPGPQRGADYGYQVVEDGYEALCEYVEDKKERDEESNLLEEATAELAADAARPVIDRRKDHDRRKDRDR